MQTVLSAVFIYSLKKSCKINTFFWNLQILVRKIYVRKSRKARKIVLYEFHELYECYYCYFYLVEDGEHVAWNLGLKVQSFFSDGVDKLKYAGMKSQTVYRRLLSATVFPVANNRVSD